MYKSSFEKIVADNLEQITILLDENLKVLYFNEKAKITFTNLEETLLFTQAFKETDYLEVTRLTNIIQDKNTKEKINYILNLENRYFEFKIKQLDEGLCLLEASDIEDEYLSNIFNSTNFGIVLCSPSTNNPLVFANDYFHNFTGFTREEAYGKSLNFLKVDDSDIEQRVAIRDAINKKIPIKTVLKNKKKNGEIYYNKVSVSPIFNKFTNRLQFFIGTLSDVTDEIKEKTYYKSMLNTSKSIIVVANNKELISVNKRFFQIFDFKNLEEFKEKYRCICELFIKKDNDYLTTFVDGILWKDYLRENTKSFHKVCMLDKNGKERIFQVESSGKLFEEAEEEVITFSEITILLKNRQLIEDQSKHAAMGEMIAMIAHQWRQPLAILSTINTKTGILYDMGMLDEKSLKESNKKSNDIIQHLSETINDFRNFFHKEEIIDNIVLKDLIRKPYNILETSFKLKQISFRVDYRNNINSIVLNIDASKFTQVLLNLFKNAYDELSSKDIEKRVLKMTCFLDEDYLNFVIEDNAGGIPEEILPNIFDPYFSTKGKNGTGIGLYMSKLIIEKHLYGRISAKNTNKGASFIIQLPKKLIREKESV